MESERGCACVRGGECVILQSRRFEHSCDYKVSVSPVF